MIDRTLGFSFQVVSINTNMMLWGCIAQWIVFLLRTQQPQVQFLVFPRLFLLMLLRTVDRGLIMSSEPFQYWLVASQYNKQHQHDEVYICPSIDWLYHSGFFYPHDHTLVVRSLNFMPFILLIGTYRSNNQAEPVLGHRGIIIQDHSF